MVGRWEGQEEIGKKLLIRKKKMANATTFTAAGPAEFPKNLTARY